MTDVTYAYDWYRGLLEQFSEAGYSFHRFDDGVPDEGILLRHDVDWSPETALEMARIESELGVSGTYFVLPTSAFYNPLAAETRAALAEIADLGHDIGLHFDSHAYFETEPDSEALAHHVRRDRTMFQDRFETVADTIAFHNPPEWVLGRCFEGFDHTYEPRFFNRIDYRADSLGRWREEPPLDSGFADPMQLLVHPGLWGPEDADPEERIRAAQQGMLSRSDTEMAAYSRLSWGDATVDW